MLDMILLTYDIFYLDVYINNEYVHFLISVNPYIVLTVIIFLVISV